MSGPLVPSANLFSELLTMRRIALFTMIGATIVLGCGDDDTNSPANPHSYQLIGPTQISLRQDSTVALRTLGFVVVKDGTDTLEGGSATALPRLSYFPENTDVAIVDPLGVIRGIGPGSTSIRVTGYDLETTLNVEVRPYPATQVILRVLSFPNGGARTVATRFDTGTFYALPSSSASMRLEGLVLVDTSVAQNRPDTVFCNYCAAATPARVNQRIVVLTSLDTTKATVTNATAPTTQAGSSGTGSTGFGIVSEDTTSTPVGIVMTVPSDGKADTVWLKFALRPIDTIVVTPGSRPVPADPPSVGTVNRTYPGDTLSANIARSDLENFDANLIYRSRIFSIPATPGPGTGSFITVSSTSRPFLPTVTWESALEGYLTINSVGGVVGSCEFIGRTGCVAPTRTSAPPLSAAQRTQAARDSLVITCTDNGSGKRLPGLKQDGVNPVTSPILFNPPTTMVGGRGMYRNSACLPVGGFPGPNIPMPGAFCTTADAADRFSTCTVWIRATITDPVTLRVIRYHYRINVRVE